VKITAIMDGESNKEHRSLKKSLADLVVEDQQGDKYIVEIEQDYASDFMHKACFNTSRLIVDSIKAGDDYTTIKKVFHISLLYFNWGDKSKPIYYGRTVMRAVDTKHPLDIHVMDLRGKVQDVSHIFPEYIVVSVPSFDDVIRQELDEWLYVLKYSEVKEEFKSPYMKRVAERLNFLKMNEQEKSVYYKHRAEFLKQRSVVSSAEAKGKEEGIKQGIQARNIEIAKNMLLEGFQADAITRITGLAKEELEKLSKSSS
jgi:predicted transposase/invertase (TIGR01784 family)